MFLMVQILFIYEFYLNFLNLKAKYKNLERIKIIPIIILKIYRKLICLQIIIKI